MSVKKHSLNTVIGPIGSGKSSLIMALLKEMPFTTGTAQIKGRVAYVEQESIMFSGIVSELITFG